MTYEQAIVEAGEEALRSFHSFFFDEDNSERSIEDLKIEMIDVTKQAEIEPIDFLKYLQNHKTIIALPKAICIACGRDL